MKTVSGFSPNRCAGFTVIELMTVLVIVAIGVSIATPSMRAYVDSMRTRHALDRLVGEVSYARLMAIEEGRKSALRIQADGTYTLEAQTTGGSWTVIRTGRLRDEFVGVTVSGTGMVLEFGSRGLVTNLTTDAHLKVAAQGARDSAFISPVGRVYRDF